MSMHNRISTFIAAFALGAMAGSPEAGAQLTESVSVTVQASVEAIDHTNRVVTLLGPEGNMADFQVAEDVERFDDLAVGDTITATYTEAIAFSVREPGEPAPEATEMSVETGRAMAQRTISVTVEEIDRDVPSMTVRGPEGNELSFRVPEDVSIADVDVGDNIDVTYTIALVVAIGG